VTQPAQGVYAALATPRRKNLPEPDTAALLDYLDTVVRTGVNGIVLFGSTGEFVHFDLADRIHALNLAIRRSRVPVLVNVSHSTLDGAVTLADDAKDRGAAGLLLMPPYFYRYADQEIEEFYLIFAKAIGQDVPIYLYNLPLYTSALSAELVTRLLQSGLFGGIKDSSGDWNLFQSLAALHGTLEFRLFAGNDRLYVRACQEGADGVVSGIAAALPELIVAIHRALQRRDEERICLLDRHLQQFLDRIERFPGSTGVKQAAVARGWGLLHMAVPLGASGTAELNSFRSWLDEWMPSILKECEKP
jgi:dihydrodipicolinate synthase/N-acetylneuraminate lyase